MTKEKVSKVIFENEIWLNFKSYLSQNSYSQYFVLVDENTRRDCLKILEQQLESLSIQFILISVSAGEESKTIETTGVIWSKLTAQKADRKALLINLGGGMITDLGGFAAATYKRGIDFLNIPTSLLAMVDASVGGKCGIDFQHFKNQVGVFKEAERTIILPAFLKTLPLKELISGFAEVIKHALIFDTTYFEELNKMTDLNSEINEDILKKSVQIKEFIVSNDPLEKGERKKLNFGHTIGHAIESYFFEKNNTIPHGFAVAAGMICEGFISKEILDLSNEEQKEIENLIQRHFDLPLIQLDELDAIADFISHDKKNEGKETQFTLLNSIGLASINHKVEKELIQKSLQYYCKLK